MWAWQGYSTPQAQGVACCFLNKSKFNGTKGIKISVQLKEARRDVITQYFTVLRSNHMIRFFWKNIWCDTVCTKNTPSVWSVYPNHIVWLFCTLYNGEWTLACFQCPLSLLAHNSSPSSHFLVWIINHLLGLHPPPSLFIGGLDLHANHWSRGKGKIQAISHPEMGRSGRQKRMGVDL